MEEPTYQHDNRLTGWEREGWGEGGAEITGGVCAPPPIGDTCVFTRYKTKHRVQLQERKRESCGRASFH